MPLSHPHTFVTSFFILFISSSGQGLSFIVCLHITQNSGFPILLRTTSTTVMQIVIEQRQMTWVSHSIHMNNNRLPKRVQYSELEKGSRKVGHPKLCYKDWIKQHIQSSRLDLMTWEDTAHDRRAWQSTMKDAEQATEYRRATLADSRRERRHQLALAHLLNPVCGNWFPVVVILEYEQQSLL